MNNVPKNASCNTGELDQLVCNIDHPDYELFPPSIEKACVGGGGGESPQGDSREIPGGIPLKTRPDPTR